MELLLFWAGIAVVTAIAAASRGRSFLGWLILGFLFSIFALIAVLVMRQKESPTRNPEPPPDEDPLPPLNLPYPPAARTFVQAPPAPSAAPHAEAPQRRRSRTVTLWPEGDYQHEVVGELYQQQELEKIAGPRSATGYHVECEAALVCEDDNPHDPHAVKVLIARRKVGYLSSAAALDHREMLEDHFGSEPRVRVKALICDGRIGPDGERETIQVKLDYSTSHDFDA